MLICQSSTCPICGTELTFIDELAACRMSSHWTICDWNWMTVLAKCPSAWSVLLTIAELKIDATLWGVKAIQTEDNFLVLTYTNKQRIEHLAKLQEKRLRIVDQQKAYWVTTPGKSIDWIKEAKKAFRAN